MVEHSHWLEARSRHREDAPRAAVVREGGRCPRPRTWALALFAGCYSLAVSTAQGAPATGYILGGAAVQEAPLEFERLWKTGVGFSAGVGLPLLSHVELVGSFSIDRFEAEGSFGPSVLGEPIEDGGNASILALLTELRVHPFSGRIPIALYFGGGVGFFRMSFEEVRTSAGADVELDAENALAVTGGGGVGLRLKRGVRLILDGHYTIGLTRDEETRYVPIRIGFSIG